MCIFLCILSHTRMFSDHVRHMSCTCAHYHISVLLFPLQVPPPDVEPAPAKPKVDRSQFLEEMRRKLDRLKGAS